MKTSPHPTFDASAAKLRKAEMTILAQQREIECLKQQLSVARSQLVEQERRVTTNAVSGQNNRGVY